MFGTMDGASIVGLPISPPMLTSMLPSGPPGLTQIPTLPPIPAQRASSCDGASVGFTTKATTVKVKLSAGQVRCDQAHRRVQFSQSSSPKVPRSELNSLPTRLGATRLIAEFNSQRVKQRRSPGRVRGSTILGF